jgi:hypothetical protein
MLYFPILQKSKIVSQLILFLEKQVSAENNKKILAAVIIAALALNVATFIEAYPRTFTPLDQTYAADFSAYYIGTWRLIHNPTAIYYSGDYIQGDYAILPKPQTFMYPPSFLVYFMPLLALDYQNALNVFNFIQLTSIFALAFLLYKLLQNKPLILGCIAAVIILLLPIPDLNQFGLKHLFQGYYWGYALANAHVIQTSLIVASIYFGFTKKPWLSAFVLSIASFDPRITLLSIPILLWYNRKSLRKFVVGSVAFIAAFNVPFFFYNNIALTFLEKRLNGGTIGAMYAYDWLPIAAVAAITAVEFISVFAATRKNQQDKKSDYGLFAWKRLLRTLRSASNTNS